MYIKTLEYGSVPIRNSFNFLFDTVIDCIDLTSDESAVIRLDGATGELFALLYDVNDRLVKE